MLEALVLDYLFWSGSTCGDSCRQIHLIDPKAYVGITDFANKESTIHIPFLP